MRAIGQSDRLSPGLILRAYALGIFPMARHRDDPYVQWVAPSYRGVIPFEEFRVPRRLRRTVRQGRLEIRCNTAFAEVVSACAEPGSDRPDTWINQDIERAYLALHRLGHAHSVEAWHNGHLVGGLYGVALGAAFFGESMFSTVADASKVALVHLVARLRIGGFALLDTQFVTEHLRQFGAIEVPASAYLGDLDRAIRKTATFHSDGASPAVTSSLEDVLRQSSTQTS